MAGCHALVRKSKVGCLKIALVSISASFQSCIVYTAMHQNVLLHIYCTSCCAFAALSQTLNVFIFRAELQIGVHGLLVHCHSSLGSRSRIQTLHAGIFLSGDVLSVRVLLS